MQSFLKFITNNVDQYDPAWLVNPDRCFLALPIKDKMIFLLRQSIMLNYLCRVYDVSLPFILIKFKDKLINDWTKTIQYDTDTDKTFLLQIQILQGTATGIVDSSLLCDALDDNVDDAECTAPIASTPTFYKPYLHYLNSLTRTPNYTEGNAVQKSESFKIKNLVSIPTCTISGRLVVMSFDTIFSSYSFDFTETHNFCKSKNIYNGVNSILAYWRGYNWAPITMNGVVGFIASQAIEFDFNAIPRGSFAMAYTDLYRIVFPNVLCNEQSTDWLSSDITNFRRCILLFLIELREIYGVKLDDVGLINALLSNAKDNDADNLRAYFSANTAAEVSAEAYSAFRESTFVCFNELNILANKRVSEVDLVEAAYANTKSESSKTLLQEKSLTKTKVFNKKKTLTSESRPSGEEEEPVEDDTQSSDDKLSIKEEQDTEQTAGTDIPNEKDDEHSSVTPPDDEPNTETDVPEENDPTHTHTTQDDFPMSDRNGVMFELSVKETTNSVFYRIELASFIDSLLQNPPKNLALQKVLFLKKIRGYWFNLLSVPCLVDLIKSQVRLPKQLTIRK